MQADWVGTWFRLLETRGFQTNVILGTLEATGEIRFKEYSHAEFDGIGVILHALREQGFSPDVPELATKFRASLFTGI